MNPLLKLILAMAGIMYWFGKAVAVGCCGVIDENVWEGVLYH